MWRPEEGWSRARTDYLTDTNNSCLGCSIEAKRIYEAGADALWNALWKMAEESPTKTFTIDSQVVSVFEEEQNVLQT